MKMRDMQVTSRKLRCWMSCTVELMVTFTESRLARYSQTQESRYAKLG
ncbi:hypothetical protein [Wenzhouxiangella sp. XN24]|nr:hypothetical protein [Wenzhouxiangella sp. XN24]NGX16575.1 hypothetical protein [Wenzhouxiangella sp. XN24]